MPRAPLGGADRRRSPELGHGSFAGAAEEAFKGRGAQFRSPHPRDGTGRSGLLLCEARDTSRVPRLCRETAPAITGGHSLYGSWRANIGAASPCQECENVAKKMLYSHRQQCASKKER